jgi:hypothetical protein
MVHLSIFINNRLELEMSQFDDELQAMRDIAAALEKLEDDARRRVMVWVSSQFDVEIQQPKARISDGQVKGVDDSVEGLGVFSDFFDRCSPSTQADKALTAAYWLKVEQDVDDATGRQVNDLLRDVGHELSNVTVAFRNLETKKPALARQSSKARGRMGHKTYRLTAAGDKAIGKMIRQGNGEFDEE